MTTQAATKLALPALRASMGVWIYYICFLKMKEIAERISVAEEIHSSESLKDLLQRRLTDRSQSISNYLLNQPQRFFNALVVATYGGNPQWNELAIRDSSPGLGSLPDYIEGSLGILTLEGTETLFAVDGQHRVKGIVKAIGECPSLADDEVCVIVVKGVTGQHRNSDPDGYERTRRLFTTLNRYAKPVSKGDIIALDEDDVIAILTRRMVEEHWIGKRISSRLNNSIHPSDKTNITTIRTLYDALEIYLRTGLHWNDYKRMRPHDEEVETFYERALELWDRLKTAFPILSEISESDNDEIIAQYRSDQGGHLLLRPVGLLVIVRVVRRLIESGNTLSQAVSKVSSIPMSLESDPWVGLFWDATNHRMLTAGENQRVAEALLYFMTGGDLSTFRKNYNENRLRTELGGILNKLPGDIELKTNL